MILIFVGYCPNPAILTQRFRFLLGIRMLKTIRFRPQELAYRTQYAELKERVLAAHTLLPGTPGTLYLRSGSGNSYWYRVYYSVPGKQAETLVCKDGNDEALEDMRERIKFAEWVSEQVAVFRKLGLQVADKSVARVLVELHARGAFDAGLVLVGTLGYMAWLNELGVVAVAARTRDVDLARGKSLKLAAPLSFLPTMQATGMPFVAVPGMPASQPSTSVKLPGVDGLRIDLLAPGDTLGAIIRIPELDWAAQAIPFYDYLLKSPEPAACLAGGHCVPVRIPQAARMFWHKLYSSVSRAGFPEKAAKDREQALVLAAALMEDGPMPLRRAFKDAPAGLIRALIPARETFLRHAGDHQELRQLLDRCLNARLLTDQD